MGNRAAGSPCGGSVGFGRVFSRYGSLVISFHYGIYRCGISGFGFDKQLHDGNDFAENALESEAEGSWQSAVADGRILLEFWNIRKFKQFYLGCLSHASYYLGSEDEAVIIDPQRDVQQYLDEAEANGQKIKFIIETHSHADFVSGHIELAEKTGAEIIYGEKAQTEFPTHKIKDGDELNIGKIKLKFLETPGHTPEGITILAEQMENPGEPVKIFTGDTLFIGDVGRPDLIGSKGFSAKAFWKMRELRKFIT